MLLCGIIKPYALNRSEEILQILQNASIVILEKKRFWYTPEMIEILYDHMSPEARDGIARRLVGLQSLSLLLSAPSIERFLEIVGKESNPRLCAPGTIRARFGIHDTPTYIGDDVWYENAFHRPIDAREAARDLALLFNVRTTDS